MQTWLQNDKPVGESTVNVVVIGTIPRDSRVITFSYCFTGMQSTGETGAPAMRIKTTAALPRSWPSTVTDFGASG